MEPDFCSTDTEEDDEFCPASLPKFLSYPSEAGSVELSDDGPSPSWRAMSALQMKQQLAKEREESKTGSPAVQFRKHGMIRDEDYWDESVYPATHTARAVFEFIDNDKSELLDIAEIMAAVGPGGTGCDLSADRLREAAATMDMDGSGSIDFSEFLQWWTNPLIAEGPRKGMFARLLRVVMMMKNGVQHHWDKSELQNLIEKGAVSSALTHVRDSLGGGSLKRSSKASRFLVVD